MAWSTRNDERAVAVPADSSMSTITFVQQVARPQRAVGMHLVRALVEVAHRFAPTVSPLIPAVVILPCVEQLTDRVEVGGVDVLRVAVQERGDVVMALPRPDAHRYASLFIGSA